MLNLRSEQSEEEVKHLAILGKIRLKLRETLRFAQGDKIFNTLPDVGEGKGGGDGSGGTKQRGRNKLGAQFIAPLHPPCPLCGGFVHSFPYSLMAL